MIDFLIVVLVVCVGALIAQFLVQWFIFGPGIRRKTTRSPNGYTRTYTRRGHLHRIDGPAVDRRRKNRDVAEQSYYVDGEEHRIDGPATVRFHEDTGVMVYEAYKRKGSRHRVDGPAEIHRFPDGEVSGVRWFFDGALAKDQAEFSSILDALPPDRIQREFRASPYRVLLDEDVTVEQILLASRSGITSVKGIREVIGGAPAEWVRAFEAGSTSD